VGCQPARRATRLKFANIAHDEESELRHGAGDSDLNGFATILTCKDLFSGASDFGQIVRLTFRTMKV
jgi:hypothetical protein